MREYVCPACIVPLLNVLSVAVTVCGMESVFVQTTVSPTLMVICAGEKVVGVIETLYVAALLIEGIMSASATMAAAAIGTTVCLREIFI